MMKIAREWFSVLVLLVGVAIGAGGATAACTPEARRDAITVTDSVVRAGCIVLRAFTDDARLREVCVTAEDLAPLFSEILAEHDRNVATEPTETATSRLQVAAVLPAPKRHPPLRRCTQWVPVVRSTGDAGRADGGAVRDGGGEGGDGGR